MERPRQKVEVEAPEREEKPRRRAYEPPRIARRRSVSRATLFTGSGPDSGGIFGTG